MSIGEEKTYRQMSKLFLRSLYLMLLTLCLPSVVSAETEVVEINSVADLKTFRDAVNSGTSYVGKIVRLMADLDLSSETNWKPIGDVAAYPSHSLQGTFDGNGHSISNLTIDDQTVNWGCAGLFGSVSNGSIINLTVKNVDIKSHHYAAGIVAYKGDDTNVSITNCHVNGGTITTTPELVGSSYDNGDKAGGIAGYCTAGTTIKDCTVEGVTITAYRDLAGICGFAGGSVADCTVKDVTVVQDNTNAYKTEDVAYTACEVVGGRSANVTATNAANTTENVTVNTGVTANYVAQIGTTKYETLQAAIDAAQADNVVELLQDIDLTTVTTTPSDKYNVNINKSITIDGKGYKVTSSAGKRAFVLTGEGNNITLKNLTVENNGSEACLWIANNLTCTLDAVTLDGTKGKTYNQPLTIGSIDDAGRVTLNVTNGSVIKTNDAGSAHYAIIAWHPADITVTNSSLIGWANVYLKPDAEGSTVNISNSTLKSQGIAGATNNFSMFTTECGNSTITLTDNNITLNAAENTYMTLITLNGSDNAVKVRGENTSFTANNSDYAGITFQKGDFESNTVTFDDGAHAVFADQIADLVAEGVTDTKAEGVYTLGYVAEVYYYWIVSGAETGGNYDFAEPFKNGWLDNGEFIRLRKDVTLSENLTWAKENASFTLTLGEFSVTKGEFSVALKKGVTVNTDKQTDIFTAADAANYTVTETEDNGTYTYTVTELPDVAQIGDVKYKSLAAAVAAVPTDGTQTTITMIADETTNASGYVVTVAKNQNVVLDLNGKSVTGNTDSETTYALITNKGTLTIQDATGTGKLEVYPTKPWVYSEANPGGYASNLIRNEGTLTVENGNLYNDGKGSACYAIDNYTGGNVTINGGTVNTAKSSAVRLFYNDKDKNGNGGGSVTVNGGVIGHYNSDDDSSYMGIQVQKGTNANVTVSGGTIAGQYALYANNTGGSIEITDGTFDGYVGFAAAVPEESISISGGTFKEWVGAWGDQTGFISGGNFATDPTEYCAAGYIGKANGDNTYSVVTGAYVAQIGTTKYETLEEAIAAAQDGETITLLADCAGNGIKVPQGKYTTGLTVDFGGFTYTVDGETVGSTGTETNGFQLLKDNKITFKNGTITSTKAKILVQNYSDLTLDGMTLTLNNANYTSAYTLSNNNGNVVIDGTTINANPAGGFAFDVCRYSSYPSVSVTVTGDSEINGDVELFASNGDAKDGFGLTLTSGTMTGNIVVDATAATAIEATPAKVTVTKADTFTKDAPAGYKWESNGDGTSTLVEDIIVLTDGIAYTNDEDITNAKVAYKRTYTDAHAEKFQPWMVPFNYTITAADVENFDFFGINKVEYAEGSTTKMQIRISSAMAAGDELEANKPYIYMPKSAVGEYSFKAKDVTLYAAGDGTEVRKSFDVAEGVEVNFYSVYQNTKPTDANYIYYMSKNSKVGYSNNANTTFAGVGPFRWIFKVSGTNAPSAAFTFGFAADEDDDVTAVSSAAVEAEGEVVGYYTLNGQKVSEPTKGVYVVKYANGTSKKVVF